MTSTTEDFMMEAEKPKVHNEISTTLKADIGYKKYHCGFFCQRKTILEEVSDPKKNEPQPTITHTSRSLTQ